DGTPIPGWPRTVLTVRPNVIGADIPMGGIVVDDLDGDGTPEIVYQFREALGVLRADGTPVPGFPLLRGCNSFGGACFEGPVAVGDVDGDGLKELAVIDSSSWLPKVKVKQSLDLWDLAGHSKPGWPKIVARARVVRSAPILADVDGDGRLDLIANSNVPKKLRVYNGAGSPIGAKPKMLESERFR